MRQAFEQGLHFVFEHAGHQPFAALFADLVEHKNWHINRHAIAGVAGLVQVAGLAIHTAQAQRFGKRLGGDACGLVAHQLFACQQQQLRLLAGCGSPPLLKQTAIEDFGRNVSVVEGVDQRVIDQHILSARFVFQLFDLGHQFQVGG